MAHQSGFAVAIRLTRALISALTGGRPPVGRAESLAQYWRSDAAATAGRCRA